MTPRRMETRVRAPSEARLVAGDSKINYKFVWSPIERPTKIINTRRDERRVPCKNMLMTRDDNDDDALAMHLNATQPCICGLPKKEWRWTAAERKKEWMDQTIVSIICITNASREFNIFDWFTKWSTAKESDTETRRRELHVKATTTTVWWPHQQHLYGPDQAQTGTCFARAKGPRISSWERSLVSFSFLVSVFFFFLQRLLMSLICFSWRSSRATIREGRLLISAKII